MIIELFGPSAAGKTTLTYALSHALQESGYDVQLFVSSRPAEHPPEEETTRLQQLHAKASHIMAPFTRAAKILGAVPMLLTGAGRDGLTNELMTLFPPRNPIRAIRYQRYLMHIGRFWAEARRSEAIVLFDQAYVTALCALIILSGCTDWTAVAEGLSLLPQPDLLIHLDAPRELLEMRLRERLQCQGIMERLFEFDVQTNLMMVDAVAQVAMLLRERKRSMIDIRSLDKQQLEAAVATIVQETAAVMEGRSYERA